jgi:DNA-binding Lrp family transcriptional regulator
MNYSFINSVQAYRILCMLSYRDGTLREISDKFVSEEVGPQEVAEKYERPQEKWGEKVSEKQKSVSNTLNKMKDAGVVETYQKQISDETKTYYALNLEELALIWVQRMQEIHSPKKALTEFGALELAFRQNLREKYEVLGEEEFIEYYARFQGTVSALTEDEKFLYYYGAAKRREEQTLVKDEEQFNPWYEFDAVAAGHDPYNIIEYLVGEFESYMDKEKNYNSTVQEMFEDVENSVTSGKVSELLSGSTGEKDAEEVIATAISHQATTHEVEIDGRLRVVPHIGSLKDQRTVPLLRSMKRKWESFEGDVREFIASWTGSQVGGQD